MSRIGVFFIAPVAWLLALFWTFSRAWPRPFDDWKEGLLYSGAAVWVIGLLVSHKRQSRVAISFPNLCVVLYGGVVCLGFFSPHVPSYELLLEAARLFLWCGLLWCCAALSADQRRVLMQWSCGSAALIALLTWTALHYNLRPWPGAYLTYFPEPIGHITYYATFMALQLPMVVYLFVTATAPWRKIGWAVCGAAFVNGLWLAASRASLIGVVGTIGILALAGWRMTWWRWRPFVYGSGVLLLLLAALHSTNQPTNRSQLGGPDLLGRLRQTVTLATQSNWDEATSHRLIGFRATLDLVADRPLTGWGLGSFRFIYPEYAHRRRYDGHVNVRTWYMHPHNEVLHQAAQTGCLGLFAWLGLWGAVYYTAYRILRDSSDTVLRGWLLLGISGITIAGICWQFDTTYTTPLIRWLAAFYGGIVWAGIRPHVRVFAAWSVPGVRTVLIGLTCGAGMLLLAYHGSLYAFARATASTVPAARLRWAHIAQSLAPGAFDPLFAYSASLLDTDDPARFTPAINALYRQFPFVPVVLYQTAAARLQTGATAEVQELLRHALANDPTFAAAKALLEKTQPIENQSLQ